MKLMVMFGCAIGIFVAGVAVAGDRADSKIIRSERFEVIGAGGKVLALFGASEGDPAMVLFDTKHRPRIVISMTRGRGASVALFDEKAISRIFIAVPGPGQQSGIAMFAANGDLISLLP